MGHNLDEATAIAIIGGADGPTSIYISGMSARELVLVAILFAILFGLSVFGLIWGIKKRSKARIIFFALVLALLGSVIFVPVVSGVYQYVSFKRMSPYIDPVAGPRFLEPDDSLGLPVEADDYDYFFAEHKIISVDDDWAGVGFLIGKKLDENEYKIVKEFYGSGLSVVAEETFIGTLHGDVLNINDEEYFLLQDHILRYFYRSKEYLVLSVEDSWIN